MFINSINLRFSLCIFTASLLFSMPTKSFANDSTYDNVFRQKKATGSELAYAFFDLLSKTGSPTGTIGTTPQQNETSKLLIRPYLDSAFLMQRSSGERYTAETYLPADVDRFQIGDIRETQPSDTVKVVRYSVMADQELPDSSMVMSKNKAPRLTVFRWNDSDSRWKVLSHANFNTPIAAICDQNPILDNKLTSSAKATDQALGEALMTKFYDLLFIGDAAPLLHPAFQYQNANGVGYTTVAERPATTQQPKTVFEKAIVTRNDNIIVISEYNSASERVLMGKYPLRGGKSARMATFQKTDQGEWRMIALASFMPAKSLPSDAVCVSPGRLEKAP